MGATQYRASRLAGRRLGPRLTRWLLRERPREGTHPATSGRSHQHPWWHVMCLTGVDYFSTLGYQPGIAFLAAGLLSPIATLFLVLVTLFGALPIYRRVAEESPHGEGSIAMLEDLLPRWRGKFFVLVILGFVATDFIITITLSAADAAAHMVENPFVPGLLRHQVGLTMLLIAILGLVFLRGFREAIGIAVVTVGLYLALNVVVMATALVKTLSHPELLAGWRAALFASPRVHGNPILVMALAAMLFPRLALGLSGFETGVAVMPLIQGDPDDPPEKPLGRIRRARWLLTTAAVIMSVFLLASSFVTTLLIPPEMFSEATDTQPAGEANGRALAYLAHLQLGLGFGTLYDFSTILILWFAGASAMAGLLSIVPRYLPRYGMAPEWARATRPLVLVFTVIAFLVTLLFRASVDAQGGAYATGVLVLISSAAIAVTLSVWKRGRVRWFYTAVVAVFGYTTIVNVIERPEGIKIASLFITAIIGSSFISRVMRTTELRVRDVQLDERARSFIHEARRGTIRIVANRRERGDIREYRTKEREKREDNHIPDEDPILFFEVTPGDASEFSGELRIRGVNVDGYHVLRCESPAVPNAIAAFLLYLRDTTGKIPHAYFGWSEGNPLVYLMRYILFGEGDTAPVTHEVLRRAEEDPVRRPAVHVGG